MRRHLLVVGSTLCVLAAASTAESAPGAGLPEAAPGAVLQQGPTRGNEMMPPFDPRYFLGD